MSQDKSAIERRPSGKSVTGEEIIEQLLANLDASQEPLRYSVLFPGVFDVYLHTQDYERLSGIFANIKAEAARALEERLTALASPTSKSGFFSLRTSTPTKEVINAAGGWYITFFVNGDADVKPGDILIDSRLTLPQTQALEGGSLTRRLSTLRRDGATSVVGDERATSKSTPRAASGGVASQHSGASTGKAQGSEQTFQGSPPNVQAARSSASVGAAVPPPPAPPRFDPKVTTERRPRDTQAKLTYSTANGKQHLVIDKPEISVGRGGTGVWVDMRLETVADVSRTHFKIRRDEQGRFYIRDLSAYGTAVNGKKLPCSLEPQGERKIDRMREVQLPSRATLDLAGVLTLEFEVLAP